MNASTRLVLQVSCGLFLALATVGCQSQPSTGTVGELAPLGELEASRLRAALFNYADTFAATVAGTADDIAAATTSRTVREMTVLWKLRVIPSVQDAALVDDPRYGFINVWGIVVLQRRHLEDEELEFDDQQQLALDAANKLEQIFLRLVASFLPPDKLAVAKEEMESFAEGQPIKGRFAGAMIRAADHAEESGGFLGFSNLLSLPISGLSEGASAIDRVANVSAVIAEMVEDLPERARWQTELLLLQVQSLDAVNRVIGDLGEASDAAQSIAATAAALPVQVREQVELLLTSTDNSQAELRTTLTEASIVLEDGTKAAAAFDSAARSVEAVLASAQKLSDSLKPERTEPAAESPPFDINDYTAAANALQAGAVELRALLDDLESGKLNATVASLDTTTASSIDHATEQARTLIDALITGGLLLIGAAFVGLLLYRLVSVKLGKS